ncbi:hypothetical protein J5N97_019405 [Dioscorea zingiberensis]|uniref:Phytocyanin domain-containing protein n=1 Tax=Dioscorea zingiberensis TaxID=325984 RepID=A0A9D5HC97_9LILI|nr:hypothetical protein J5N97_019405 [Dioscorea zingiberensis]
MEVIVFGVLLVMGLMMMSSSMAYDFYVGGRDGWVQNPKENYNNWAGRNRFSVNDKLVFKYKKGEDSVLVVNKIDYDACNVSNPIKKMDDGDSVFVFDRSGPFFFISGAPGKCGNGQKLIVEQSAEAEKVQKLCDLLEEQLRFMTIDENQEYSLPVLDIIETNLEVAINKVRAEKERKIQGEIGRLESMVGYGQQEKFGLCEKLARVQELKELAVLGGGANFSYELDLKLGFD